MKPIFRRLSALLLCLALLAALVPGIPAARAAQISDVPDASWYAETGTTLTIKSAAQLAGLSKLVAEGVNFSGKTILLAADITLNDATNFANWAAQPPANEWTPIGSSSALSFAGTFDGQGHTISGLYLSSTTAAGKVGLFGYVTGTVRDLKLSEAYLSASGGNTYLGGICAYLNAGTIEDCTVSGVMNSVGLSYNNNSAGGIVGSIGTKATVSRCVSMMTATGSYTDSGLIAGSNYGTVEDCAASGSVLGEESSYVGGLVGYNSSILANCASYADVSGKRYIGGLVGYVSKTGSAANCISTGKATSTESVGAFCGAASGTFSSCYYLASDTGMAGLGNKDDAEAQVSAFTAFGTMQSDEDALLRKLNSWVSANAPHQTWTQKSSFPMLDGIGGTPASEVPDTPEPEPKPEPEPTPTSSSAPQVRFPLAALADLNRRVSAPLSVSCALEDQTLTCEIASGGKLMTNLAGGIILTMQTPPAGDVAALVREDGSLQILPTSIVSEQLVYIPVSGSATVKILSNAATFSDVAEGIWYEEAAAFCSSHGLMNGVTDDTFAPSTNISRAMILSVLYRLQGSPKQSGSTGFSDVSLGAWYGEAVAWAYQSDILSGIFSGKLQPNAAITREQLAMLLYRYARAFGPAPTSAADLSAYADADKVSEAATPAMAWAVGYGIITGSGTTEVKLNPTGFTTRAQLAVMLQRLLTANARIALGS